LYAIYSPQDPKKSRELIRLYENDVEKDKDLLDKYVGRYKIKAIHREQ
jgi:hypothetical protein